MSRRIGSNMTHQLALWFVPNGDRRLALRRGIEALARRYDTVAFDPHVTLLGGIRLSEEEARFRLSGLATVLGQVPIRLTVTSWGREYYQCVFVEVDRDERLIAARDRARTLFAVETEATYRPHLSLVYGDVDVGLRQRIANELGSSLRGEGFNASTVQLWNVTGGVGEWAFVADVKLS